MSKATKRERQKENRERARIERERLVKRDRQMKTLRGFLILAAIFVVGLLVINALTSDDGDKKAAATGNKLCAGKPVSNPTRTFAAAPPNTIDPTAKYRATVCTTEGDFTMSLDAKTAPIATNNFVFLADQGFYDGLTFHRASKDFVIQGGDPKGDGSGGPGYSVTGEVPTDHYPLGSLAAAKTGTDPAGTFGSQFFVVTGKNGATLPNDYARFGKVVSGLKNAQKIESFAPASGDGVPTKKVTITRIVITVNGKVASASTSSTTAAPATSSTTAAAATSSTTAAPATSSTTAAATTSTTAAASTTTTSKP